MTKKDIIVRALANETLSGREYRLANKLLMFLDSTMTFIPNPVPDDSFRSDVMDAIRQTLTDEFGYRIEDVFSHSRKRELVYLRDIAHYIYQNITGTTQEQTVAAFGNCRCRGTYPNMKKKVEDFAMIYPEFGGMFNRFRASVTERMSRES